MNEDPSEQVQAEQTHPAATSHADGAASLAPLPQAGGVGGGPEAAELPPAARTPRHNEWTRAKRAAFLRELAASQNVSQAAKSVGMSRKSAYALRNRMPGTPFALAWEVALEAGLQQLAHAVMDRALNGEEVPQYYHGELVGTYRKFDNRLAAWLLDNPWKVGRHQVRRELASEDWEFLLDQVEFGDEFPCEPMAEEVEAAFGALLSDDERAVLADPLARQAAESWYVTNWPARARRAAR